jgi:hypothetical protein
MLTQMGSNAEAVDLVALLVETQNRLFVDVVRGDNGEVAEPRYLKAFGHTLECLPGEARQVSQIAGIDANAHRPVALVVQCQGDSAEVQQSTPKINIRKTRTFEFFSSFHHSVIEVFCFVLEKCECQYQRKEEKLKKKDKRLKTSMQ